MNYAYALTLKGKVIHFTYKGEARTVRVNQVEDCKNGQQVIKGVDHNRLNEALNSSETEVGSELDFTRTFRLKDMTNVVIK